MVAQPVSKKMAKYKWQKHKESNPVWTWFSLESSKGVYEVIPLLMSSLRNKNIYIFEVTFKGKLIAVTSEFVRTQMKAGQASGRLLAQKHLES